jgi:uncharacterized membrane protein
VVGAQPFGLRWTPDTPNGRTGSFTDLGMLPGTFGGFANAVNNAGQVVEGDSKQEANETFNLDLFGNSNNSWFTKNRGIGTILNDDCAHGWRRRAVGGRYRGANARASADSSYHRVCRPEQSVFAAPS